MALPGPPVGAARAAEIRGTGDLAPAGMARDTQVETWSTARAATHVARAEAGEARMGTLAIAEIAAAPREAVHGVEGAEPQAPGIAARVSPLVEEAQRLEIEFAGAGFVADEQGDGAVGDLA